MANQLGMSKSLAIRNLRASGLSERKIAEALGVSRGAVRRHLAAESSKDTKAPTGSDEAEETGSKDTKAPTGSEVEPRELESFGSRSQCEAFREVILAKLELGLSAQRVFQDLVEEHDFSGKYWSVNRFVRKLNKSTPLPFRRMEVAPGAEMQVDFGAGARTANAQGKFVKTHIFRGVLSHSRKGYTEAVRRLTTESFIRSLENAFWRLGGVPEVVVFDNAKCAVLKADWYDPELHPKIIEFSKHYGFTLLPTRPRTPRHKGKVERGVDYAQENALRGRTFETLALQNEHLDQWEKSVADTRIHGTIQKQVGPYFHEAERPALRPLPNERFPYYEETQRRVSRDGHIAVGKAFYSVPPEYLGHLVWVRYNSHVVRVLNHRMENIALHAAKEPGRFSTLGEHIADEKIHGVERGVEGLLRKIRSLGTHATRWSEAVISDRGVHSARVLQGLLSLSKKHTSEEINAACDTAWKSRALNYRVVKRLLANRTTAAQQTMEFMDTHPAIRPVSEYAKFVKESLQGRYENVG